MSLSKGIMESVTRAAPTLALLNHSSAHAARILETPWPLPCPHPPDFRTTKAGRRVTHALVRGLEAVGVAPKGSLEVRARVHVCVCVCVCVCLCVCECMRACV
jgi:hypothetical protein